MPLGPPKNLNRNLYGTGSLSVNFPSLVDYRGGSGCEFVAFCYVLACAGELVEAAGLAFHRFPILQPGGVRLSSSGKATRADGSRWLRLRFSGRSGSCGRLIMCCRGEGQFTLAPPQYFLYFFPEPHGHGSFRHDFGSIAPIHRVSRSSHFSTRAGRHCSSARNNSAGDSLASTSPRFSGFRNRSSTAWSNIASKGV